MWYSTGVGTIMRRPRFSSARQYAMYLARRVFSHAGEN